MSGRADMGAVALGVRAVKGGGVVVGVTLEDAEPRVVLSTFLATAADGDRLAFEPYHVAAGMPRGADGEVSAEAVKAVEEGRRRQDETATKNLAGVVQGLQDQGAERVIAALLVNRAGWVTDLLSYSLGSADHPPVAEGLAVREAFRVAFERCAIAFSEMDEKSLPELASEVLGRSSGEIDATIKALGASAGRPWRKEQKLACLAAWVALAAKR